MVNEYLKILYRYLVPEINFHLLNEFDDIVLTLKLLLGLSYKNKLYFICLEKC